MIVDSFSAIQQDLSALLVDTKKFKKDAISKTFVQNLIKKDFIFLASTLLALDSGATVYTKKKGLYLSHDKYLNNDISLLQHFMQSDFTIKIYQTSWRSPIAREVNANLVLIRVSDSEILMLSGLFTASVYNSSALQNIYLKHKIEDIIHRSKFPQNGHNYRMLINIIESFPKDELFICDNQELLNTMLGIFHLRERQVVKVFAHTDHFSRNIRCFVFLPKERYSTKIREEITRILVENFYVHNVDYKVFFSHSVLCRIDFNLSIKKNAQ